MPVKTERHGGVLVVQLDRDEKRNAINGEMTESISAALDAGEDGRKKNNIYSCTRGWTFRS